MNKQEIATLAAGCFWCYQPIFDKLEGIDSVVAGYSGGHSDGTDYRSVMTGMTGFAESFQIKFNPELISFSQILEVFWFVHDPTTLNKQGYDVGTEYRSAIFYHSESQRDIAMDMKQKLDESGTYKNPIVTEISPFDTFITAEKYHQDFYEKNPNVGYCTVIVKPKIEKALKKFAHLIKNE